MRKEPGSKPVGKWMADVDASGCGTEGKDGNLSAAPLVSLRIVISKEIKRLSNY